MSSDALPEPRIAAFDLADLATGPTVALFEGGKRARGTRRAGNERAFSAGRAAENARSSLPYSTASASTTLILPARRAGSAAARAATAAASSTTTMIEPTGTT